MMKVTFTCNDFGGDQAIHLVLIISTKYGW